MTDWRKSLVEAGYDSMAEEHLRFVAATEGDPRLRFLADLDGRLSSGSEVLDLGCGAGEPCTRLLAERHNLTGVDISAEQLRLAAGFVPSATFIRADLAEVNFPAATFDAVTAFYSMTHVPREEHALVFGRVHDWLRPGGYFLVTLSARGESNGVQDEFIGVPMFFSCHAPDVSRALLQAAGFSLILDEAVTMQEPGAESSFLWVLAQKQGAAPSLGAIAAERNRTAVIAARSRRLP